MKKVISGLTLSLLITTFGASTAFAGEGHYVQQKIQERMEEKQTPSQEACKSQEQNQKLKQETQKKMSYKRIGRKIYK